jgi:hypothetical protein
VGQTDDQMDEASIGALANLATATSAATSTDRGVVATLTEVNTRLARQLEDRSKEVKEVKALLKKEHAERRGQRHVIPSANNYCWSHGYKVAKSHTGQSCNFPKNGHKREATKANNMGGCQAKKEWCVGVKFLKIVKSLKAAIPHHLLKIMKRL